MVLNENILKRIANKVINEIKYLSMNGDDDVTHGNQDYYIKAFKNLSRLPRSERHDDFPVKHKWINFNDFPELKNQAHLFNEYGDEILANYLQIPRDWVKKEYVFGGRVLTVSLDIERIRNVCREAYDNNEMNLFAVAQSFLTDTDEIFDVVKHGNVEWRDVPLEHGRWTTPNGISYRVSNYGDVLGFNRNTLQIGTSQSSYFKTTSRTQMVHLGKATTVNVGWVVAITFPELVHFQSEEARQVFEQEPNSKRLSIKMIDGDPKNTKPDNLKVCLHNNNYRAVMESKINRIVNDVIKQTLK